MWSILQFQPKPPSTPCRDLPAWANRDRQTLVARNLSPNLPSPDRPLMPASHFDCPTLCRGSSQCVFTLWNTKREGDAFAVQRQCEGDWRRSTQGLSPLTLRQGLTHQCPPYKMLPTVTINVFIWTHGTEVAAMSHSAGMLALIEIWSN